MAVWRFLLVLLLAVGPASIGSAAFAQSAVPIVTATCGSQTLVATQNANPYEDTTGKLCTSGGGGSGATPATIATSAVGVTSQVVKASAGTLFSFEVEADSTLAGSAWYVMFFDATSVPSAGTVAPKKCYWVPASTQQTGGTFASGGIAFTTGIVEVVSSAGCGTYTPSAHATLSADYQ